MDRLEGWMGWDASEVVKHVWETLKPTMSVTNYLF